MLFFSLGLLIGLILFPLTLYVIGTLTEDPADPEVQFWADYTAQHTRTLLRRVQRHVHPS